MKTYSPILIHCLLAGVLLAASGRIVRGSAGPGAFVPQAAPLAAAGVVPDGPGPGPAAPPCVRVDLVGLGTLVGAVASLVMACGKAADMVIRAWRGEPPGPASSG